MEKRKRVLVVDDEAPVRRVLELKLKNGGYDVLLADNGEDALKIIESEKPDAVVTDINMPRMNGKELCGKTNDLKRERPFLTIIMTARIFPDEEQWIAGMLDTLFMEKPFSPSYILESIDQYFGEKK
ncbi:MAG TPA: response regulator [Syntrophales bacterium]|nr:response regulator [Syntrophales bacterium]